MVEVEPQFVETETGKSGIPERSSPYPACALLLAAFAATAAAGGCDVEEGLVGRNRDYRPRQIRPVPGGEDAGTPSPPPEEGGCPSDAGENCAAGEVPEGLSACGEHDVWVGVVDGIRDNVSYVINSPDGDGHIDVRREFRALHGRSFCPPDRVGFTVIPDLMPVGVDDDNDAGVQVVEVSPLGVRVCIDGPNAGQVRVETCVDRDDGSECKPRGTPHRTENGLCTDDIVYDSNTGIPRELRFDLFREDCDECENLR